MYPAKYSSATTGPTVNHRPAPNKIATAMESMVFRKAIAYVSSSTLSCASLESAILLESAVTGDGELVAKSASEILDESGRWRLLLDVHVKLPSIERGELYTHRDTA